MWIMTVAGLVNTNQLVNIDIKDESVGRYPINTYAIKGYEKLFEGEYLIKQFNFTSNNKSEALAQAEAYLVQLQEKLNKGDYNI